MSFTLGNSVPAKADTQFFSLTCTTGLLRSIISASVVVGPFTSSRVQDVYSTLPAQLTKQGVD